MCYLTESAVINQLNYTSQMGVMFSISTAKMRMQQARLALQTHYRLLAGEDT